MRTLILALIFISLLATEACAGIPRSRQIRYVGQVIIVGNTITQDRVIRQALTGVQPGQILRPRQLKIAERKLASMGIFKIDPATKSRPTIQVLDSPGPFKDILVKIEEKSTRQWHLETGLNALGQPILRVVLEDRNFDPFGLPTSWADIEEGKAFAGGGQRVRLEVMRLIPSQGRFEAFPDSSLPITLVRGWIDGMGYPTPWNANAKALPRSRNR
jgi:hypothetical protein